MKPSEKAKLLIQQAQEKGRADFERWKEGYLSAKLKHRTGQEARAWLREKYVKIQDWYSANAEKPFFDVVNTQEEELARAWASCFVDWEESLIPFPGKTPPYSEEAINLQTGETGPFIPASWLFPLAERFKVGLILKFIDSALNDKLEVWQRNKFNQIAFAAKLAIKLVLKAGALPEAAILEALEKAQTEEGKAGALPEEAVQQLAQELLEECRGARSEDELAYLQKRIDNAIQRKPQQQEPDTKIWALFYYYTKPELHGNKKALLALGESLRLGPDNFYQTFGAINKNRDKNPLKLNILEKVIPMLSEYPKALELAKADLEKLQKNIKE